MHSSDFLFYDFKKKLLASTSPQAKLIVTVLMFPLYFEIKKPVKGFLSYSIIVLKKTNKNPYIFLATRLVISFMIKIM